MVPARLGSAGTAPQDSAGVLRDQVHGRPCRALQRAELLLLPLSSYGNSTHLNIRMCFLCCCQAIMHGRGRGVAGPLGRGRLMPNKQNLRVVECKPQPCVVSVEGLSSSTTDVQLKSLLMSVGPIQVGRLWVVLVPEPVCHLLDKTLF